jgi:beta-glucosidase
LSGNIAAAYINGLQSQGIGATIKHYAANETEWQRRRINVRVSAKALREIYYMPFQIAMRDAMPWCVMTSYKNSKNPLLTV